MCSFSRGAAGSLSVSMARHREVEGAFIGSASYTLPARKWFPVQRPVRPRPKPFAAVARTPGSHPESLAKAAFAGRRDANRPRLGVAADPVQRETARRQRRAEGAADMEAPLAPVETGPAIDMRARSGAEIHAKVAAEADAGLGHRAALAGQLDIAALGARVRAIGPGP